MYTTYAYRDHNFILGVLLLLQNALNRTGFHNSLIQLKFNPKYLSKIIHTFLDQLSLNIHKHQLYLLEQRCSHLIYSVSNYKD